MSTQTLCPDGDHIATLGVVRRLWLAKRPDRAPRPLLGERVELMSAADRCTHYATDTAYGEALAARTGTVPAVCGHTITLCALVTPPGPLCRSCVAVS